MKLISVNVGLPREVTWKGKPVTTAIFKEAVQGPISLRTLNLDGLFRSRRTQGEVVLDRDASKTRWILRFSGTARSPNAVLTCFGGINMRAQPEVPSAL